MTILKKLSCLLLTTAVLFACTEDDGFTPPPHPTDPTASSNSFEAILDIQKVSGTPVGYSPVLLLDVQYEGSGNSNIMSHVTLEATHVEEIFNDQNTFNIEQGDFILRDEAGDEIYGSYRGYGSKSTHNVQLDWRLQIQGGTGRFASAQGNLVLSAWDLKPTDTDMRAKITGNIRLLEQF